jgi:tetratricopeptide (TPR) repeat protein
MTTVSTRQKTTTSPMTTVSTPRKTTTSVATTALASDRLAVDPIWKAMLKARDYPALLLHASDALDRGGPASFLYRGKALEGLLQNAEAKQNYRTGLERFADDARLHLALGQLELREGSREGALVSLERALALDPDLLDGYAALLHLRPLDPDGPEAARILARALDDRLSNASQARALFLLGQLQVEAGRDRPGFAFYRQGNRLAARAFEKRQRQYRVPGSVLRLERDSFDAVPRPVPPFPGLIVTGLPRSGKSLVEGLLAEHPAISAGGEIAGLRQGLADLGPDPDAALREQAALGRSPFADAYGAHPLARNGSSWIVDTSPANLSRLGHLARLHPDVAIVLCRRRPEDLGLALYFKKFRSGHGYSYDLATAGRAIATAERLIAHWQAVLPNPILIVDYEDLVTDVARTRARLFAHLGLELPAAVGPTKGDWRLFPSKSPGVGIPLNPSLVGFSNRFTTELRPLFTAYEAARKVLTS